MTSIPSKKSAPKLCKCGCGKPAVISQYTARTEGRVKGEPRNFARGHRIGHAITHPEKYFWPKVKKGKKNECWEWQGCFYKKSGYGSFHVKVRHPNGNKFRIDNSHRFVYYLTHGDIPDGIFVLHKCDNRACCNPNHLFLGTHVDNMQDMVHKSRHGHMVHLTPEVIQEIRDSYIPFKVSAPKLAKRYGISQSTVWLIVHHKGYYSDHPIP